MIGYEVPGKNREYEVAGVGRVREFQHHLGGWGGRTSRNFPSIHMPCWASRIMLEITAVRIERLSDISLKDAEAEGVELRRVSESDYRWIDYTDKGGRRTFGDPRHSFWSLWKSISGEESHDANPWLWVVEFKKVGAGETANPIQSGVDRTTSGGQP